MRTDHHLTRVRWTEEGEAELLKLTDEGEKSWSELAEHFDRTEDALKDKALKLRQQRGADRGDLEYERPLPLDDAPYVEACWAAGGFAALSTAPSGACVLPVVWPTRGSV